MINRVPSHYAQLTIRGILVLAICFMKLSVFSDDNPAESQHIKVSLPKLESTRLQKSEVPKVFISYRPAPPQFSPEMASNDFDKSKYSPKVILIIWADGTTVWSDDHVFGGPPYFVGKISPELLNVSIGNLESRGVFDASKKEVVWSGSHSDLSTLLVIKDTQDFIQIHSDHESYEFRYPSLIRSNAAEPIARVEGKDTIETLAEQDSHSVNTKYLMMRIAYQDAKSEVLKLIPAATDFTLNGEELKIVGWNRVEAEEMDLGESKEDE